MYKHSPFPWKPVDSELFAFGSGTAIILLNSREGSKVLRIYRKSLGKPLSGLLEVTRHYKENLEILRSWYGNSTDLIPPMEFLVLSGLPFGSPVAASLQPYIRGQKKDFFADFSDEELLELLEQHRHLRKQFELFASQTLRQWEDGKMCFDFLGRENLMTVNQDGNYRLCIVDVGIFQFDKVVKKYPQKIIQIEKRMDRLATLYHKVKQVQPHITPDFDV
jgi:hypothetical protein